jgi:hypothetical protein
VIICCLVKDIGKNFGMMVSRINHKNLGKEPSKVAVKINPRLRGGKPASNFPKHGPKDSQCNLCKNEFSEFNRMLIDRQKIIRLHVEKNKE